MRSRSIVAVAMGLAVGIALVVPAKALAAAPDTTSLSDTAVAYYRSPNGSRCAILSLSWVAGRPLGGELSYSQHLDVQLSDATCKPSDTRNGVDLDASDYRIVSLTRAYVDVSLKVAGQPVSVDVAWTATGTPQVSSYEFPDGTVTITRDVSAHLTGIVVVDGVFWAADPAMGSLSSGTITGFSVAPRPSPSATSSGTLPPTSTLTTQTGPADGAPGGGLALLMLLSTVAARAWRMGWGARRHR